MAKVFYHLLLPGLENRFDSHIKLYKTEEVRLITPRSNTSS